MRINLTGKCFRNYLLKTINSIPNQILIHVDTHSMDGFASAVKHHLISKYVLECQDESSYSCQRQPHYCLMNKLKLIIVIDHYTVWAGVVCVAAATQHKWGRLLSGRLRPVPMSTVPLWQHKPRQRRPYEVIRQYDSCNMGELDRHAQHQQPCLAGRTLRVIVRQEQPVLSGTHWSSFAHRQMSVVLCLRRFPMKIENCHIRHQRPLKVHQRPPR